MAISKVVLSNDDGTSRTLVDLTGDTVTAGSLLSGITAHGADGEIITGSIDAFPNNQISTNPDLYVQGSGVSVGTSVMLYAYYMGTNKVLKTSSTVGISVSNATMANGIKLTADKIVAGNTILGVSGSVSIVKYYTGSSAPSSSLGNDGDIYLMTGTG